MTRLCRFQIDFLWDWRSSSIHRATMYFVEIWQSLYKRISFSASNLVRPRIQQGNQQICRLYSSYKLIFNRYYTWRLHYLHLHHLQSYFFNNECKLSWMNKWEGIKLTDVEFNFSVWLWKRSRDVDRLPHLYTER